MMRAGRNEEDVRNDDGRTKTEAVGKQMNQS